MYVYFLYIIFIVFIALVGYKVIQHKPEWMLLLIILSYIKSCIAFLFGGTTVFTVVTIGGIQVHLDDIILICLLVYCCFTGFNISLRKSIYTKSILLLIIPISLSLFRGFITGTIGSTDFLADTRTFIPFLVSLISFFLLLRNPNAIIYFNKYKKYIHRLMSAILVYVLVIWGLDLFFGIQSLPGQIAGTLSDGGSTFRIINPPQALIIAFYALNQLYKDLMEKNKITIRTFLFILIVVLLQWRTVVASFLFAVVLIIINAIIRRKFLSKRLLKNMLFFVPIVIVLVVFFSIGNNVVSGMVENLFSSFANIGNGTGTFATRTKAWTMLLTSLSGINVFIGRPFGSGNAASVTWVNSAHSGYVDYIMIVGYIGLLCLALFMGILIVGAYKKKYDFMSIMLIALLVYWFSYGVSIEHGVILGICLAVLNQSKRIESRKVGGTDES